MQKIIHHLRSKSETTKRHILRICMIFFIIVLVILLFYSLGQNFNNVDTQIKMKESLKPFDSLKENIIGGYNSLKQ